MDWSLIGRAVFWGLVGGLTAIQTAGGLPHDYAGWAGLVLAILWAGYGKGSTNTKLVGPGRDAWTEDERRAAAGLAPKRPVQ
jgi:hypothetical protein